MSEDDDEDYLAFSKSAKELIEALRSAGAVFDGDGWDDYDNSIELYGVPADFRMTEAQQRLVYDAGFSKAYVNHIDKWETHYGFALREPFKAIPGWRVSYPHKRGENEKGIWVEHVVKGWPSEWFESGYVLIKEPSP